MHDPAPPHWVGDGFPVRSVFSYDGLGRDKLSPFLLLDYAAPAALSSPTTQRRGVGEHPHRGFETVTIVYQGELEHRDSAGNGGRIGPGDVQWMTAASGILHEEFHSGRFTREGGTMEMMQLWVNLPAKDKMSKPGYQTLLDADIPRVALPDGAGTLRVIAGAFAGHRGPARTFTPINVWDLRLTAGGTARLCRCRRATRRRWCRCTVASRSMASARPAKRELVVLERARAASSRSQQAADATVLVLGGEAAQ